MIKCKNKVIESINEAWGQVSVAEKNAAEIMVHTELFFNNSASHVNIQANKS